MGYQLPLYQFKNNYINDDVIKAVEKVIIDPNKSLETISDLYICLRVFRAFFDRCDKKSV